MKLRTWRVSPRYNEESMNIVKRSGIFVPEEILQTSIE
jgi:hypothetical protein